MRGKMNPPRGSITIEHKQPPGGDDRYLAENVENGRSPTEGREPSPRPVEIVVNTNRSQGRQNGR